MAQFTLEPDKNRMIVRCTDRGEGSVILNLPSRRWVPTKSQFVVPMTRMNADLLVKAHHADQIDVPGEAMAKLRELMESGVGNREFPKWYTFKTAPRPDQRDALTKIYKNDVGALLMPMGTGKTKVSIDLMTAHFYERRIAAVVVICPLTISSVWNLQLKAHSPCDYQFIGVDSALNWRRVELRADRITWLVVGIESLSQGKTIDAILPFITEHPCGMVVDESSRIKNHKTIRTDNVMKMGKQALTRIIMTGTPSPKKMIDLFSQYQFLDPNIIGVGDFFAFRNRYCIMGGYKHREIIGYDNVEELMGLIEPYTFICDKPKDLPPKTYADPIEVRMESSQADMYRSVKSGLINSVNISNTLTKLLRLQQISAGYLKTDKKIEIDPTTGKKKTIPGEVIWQLPNSKNPKIQALLEYVEELDDNLKLIIWAKSIWEVDRICEAISPYGRIIRFVGDTTEAERDSMIDDFQNGSARFWVGTAQKGGMGLTLTAAHHMVYFSNTFSWEDRTQSEDRVHRIGQKNYCMYTDIVMKGSVDRLVLRALAEKKDLDQYIKDQLKKVGKLEEVINTDSE